MSGAAATPDVPRSSVPIRLTQLANGPWAAVALVLLVVLVYLPVRNHGFIWDDDAHVTANPTIVGPEGLREIWSSGSANYFPLSLTTFWLIHRVWDLSPAPYHVVNVLFHAIAVVLLWRVLRQLRVPGAWLAAAWWGVHPVQVESVAWISELKNTQSAIFYLLAIGCFLRWLDAKEGPRRRVFYSLLLVCALAAILSKSAAVMLPVVLALCWWWRERRWQWNNLRWLAPLVLLSALAAGWTIWEQKMRSGAQGHEWNQTLMERGVIAGRAFWFYLGKIAWPGDLTFIYPRWQTAGVSPWALAPLFCVVGLFVWAAASWRTWGRSVLFGLGYHGVSIFPVMGFFSVYFFRYSFVADHFQYLASMGSIALLSAAIVRAIAGLGRREAFAAVAVLLLAAGATSCRLSEIYASNKRLWTVTHAQNPAAWLPRDHLAVIAIEEGRPAEAAALFEQILREQPDEPTVHCDFGRALSALGRFDAARHEFEEALRLEPRLAQASNNLGGVLIQLGKPAEAIEYLAAVLVRRPNYADAHANLAEALLELGRGGEALPHAEAALRSEPDSAKRHYLAARALRAAGRGDAAVTRFARAAELAGADRVLRVSALNNQANALLALGRARDAVAPFEAVLRDLPSDPRAHANLARALAESGQVDAALKEYAIAVRGAPEHPEIRNNHGIALVSAGRLDEAIAEFEAALRLKPDYAAARDNLAQVRARRGPPP